MCVFRSPEPIHRRSSQKPGMCSQGQKRPVRMNGTGPDRPLIGPLIQQVVTNCKNTVQGFKRFHGRAFSDPFVQRLKNSLVYDIAQMPTGTTGIKVREQFQGNRTARLDGPGNCSTGLVRERVQWLNNSVLAIREAAVGCFSDPATLAAL